MMLVVARDKLFTGLKISRKVSFFSIVSKRTLEDIDSNGSEKLWV
jgi:hypothetical protein